LLLSFAVLADPPKPADATRAEIKSMFGFVPGFLAAVPDLALPGAWEEMKSLQLNPNTALPPKIKELIGLAVASQIPCKYCIYAHTEFAKLNGASTAECGEAVIVGSLTRHWSTVLQGQQTDLAKWRAEIATAKAHAMKMTSGKVPPPAAINVTDAASAMRDIQNYWGAVPDVMKRFPQVALAGAWRELRDVEMNPNTQLSDKHKSLIGLAVASQVPCRFCIHADTEFAKLQGTTQAEIDEAIALAALTRHWSTFVNGMMIDEKAFMKDVDRLVKGAKKAMVSQSKADGRRDMHAKAGGNATLARAAQH
jgi:AhpD family alkylhydroperoxidase